MSAEICLVCAAPPSIRFPEVSASRATSNIVLSESSRLNSPPYDHPHNVWQWMTHHNATNAARIKDAFGGEVAKRLLHLKGALFRKQQVSLDLNTVPQASACACAAAVARAQAKSLPLGPPGFSTNC